MKWYPCMETCSYLLFLLAWLIPLSSKYAAWGTYLGVGRYNNIQCIEEEREALLQFKQGIEADPCGLLTSWAGRECCQWNGVHCSNRSGHVISLHLRGTAYEDGVCVLRGRVSPFLVKLKHLRYLDLSNNGFDQTIPRFIGSLLNLQYLNLSYNNFLGEIPPQLANLSSLTSLDLGDNYDGLFVKSLRWLSHLTLLKELNLSYVDLSLAADWMKVIHNLPFLRVLNMNMCGLSQPPMYMNISTGLHFLGLGGNNFNDTSVFRWIFYLTEIGARLTHLDLSRNRIPGPIPEAISNLNHLEHLDLSWNKFQGIISKNVGNLCHLQTLELGHNNLTEELSSTIHSLSGCAQKSLLSLILGDNQVWGPIPDMISTFSSLRELDLQSNMLNGTISQGLGQLSMLEVLNLSFNSLKGTLSEHHLSNLSSLRYLYLDDNPELVVNISANWTPPFQLERIQLRSCKLGPHFPNWFLTQKSVLMLDISNTGIVDTLPLSFWKSISSDVQYLNVSHNNIYGVIPNSSTTFHSSTNYATVDFSWNRMEGAIPSFLGNFNILVLNSNMFSDSIELLCPKTKAFVSYLDLSDNKLSGQPPDCWKNFEQLSILRLANNHFTGKLPTSIGALKFIKELYIRNNSFVGEVPKSFENLTSLVILDLAYNLLSGYMPHGIGNMHNLTILNLRNNNFDGNLALSICQLSNLQILDLSSNHISGAIPKCIHNLTAMVNPKDLLLMPSLDVMTSSYRDSAMIMWKGKEQTFRNTLGLVKYVAISDNHLQGQIPSGISLLRGLGSLDLARNNLTGTIPSDIGKLTSLQLLDLSSNHLLGEIPTSLVKVSSLEVLDLSNNDLSGRIPQGTQLQSFDPAAYIRNPRLCGPPLPKCPEDVLPTNTLEGDDIIKEEGSESSQIIRGFYISAVLGFIVGFWGVFGSLLLKRTWRQTYF